MKFFELDLTLFMFSDERMSGKPLAPRSLTVFKAYDCLFLCFLFGFSSLILVYDFELSLLEGLFFIKMPLAACIIAYR